MRFSGSLVIISIIMPSLIAFYCGNENNFSSYGFPKILLTLFLLVLARRWLSDCKPVPGESRGRMTDCLSMFLLLCSALFNLTGFYSVSLMAGISALVLIFEDSRSDWFKKWAILVVLAVILMPMTSYLVIQQFRLFSVNVVDKLLELTGYAFSRDTFCYRMEGFEFEVWERCSGYSSTRTLTVIFMYIFLIRRQYLKMLILGPALALVTGLSANILRIYTHVTASVHAGRILSENMHVLIGLVYLAAFCSIPFMILMRHPLSIQGCFNEKACRVVPGRKEKIAVFFLVLLQLGFLPGRMEKRIDHVYEKRTSRNLEIVHENEFSEYPGGGRWILFEHPVTSCYGYSGWTETSGVYRKQSKRVKIETVFRIGGKEYVNRLAAVLVKMFRIDLCRRPVEARIKITEIQ